VLSEDVAAMCQFKERATELEDANCALRAKVIELEDDLDGILGKYPGLSE
jgi:hypothetical protein